jgi:hypothetical protein
MSFAALLRNRTAGAVADLGKVVERVKRACLEEAGKGHGTAQIYLPDFICCEEELRSELDVLGLEVRGVEVYGKMLMIHVEWPQGRRGQLFQPCGLTSGNHGGECKICYQSSTMCRLHPCGHLVGSCCGVAFIEKPCPFCKRRVRLAHALFEP